MKGQSIMNNPEKLAKLDTLDIGQRITNSQHKKLKDVQRWSHQKSEVNPGEGQAILASDKTTFLLLI
jgi:hypothetical protein